MQLARQSTGGGQFRISDPQRTGRQSISRPSSDPSLVLDLQFQRDAAFVSRRGPLPTFTRASAAWCVNSAGLIVPAAINEARIDYDPTTLACRGVLLEEQRTNLCLWSEDFSQASWSKFQGTVVANQGVAPDGNTTADLLYATSTGSITGQLFRTVAGLSVGNVVTTSFFVKNAGKNIAYLAKITSGSTPDAYYNLTTGVISNVTAGLTATMQQYINGWWRISLTSTVAAGTNYAWVGAVDSAGSTTNTASGTNGLLVWGAQVEVGAFATSPIPTTSAAVVRSADVCSITGAAFSGFWNASEGAIVLKLQKSYAVPASISQLSYLSVNDGTSNNYIQLCQRGSGTTGEVFRMETGGTSQALLQASASTIAANTAFGLAGVYKANDVRASCNGGAVASDASATVPTLTRLEFVTVTSSLWISSLQCYNIAKTNAQLQILATP